MLFFLLWEDLLHFIHELFFDKTFFVLFKDLLRLYFRKTITEVLNTEYSINAGSK